MTEYINDFDEVCPARSTSTTDRRPATDLELSQRDEIARLAAENERMREALRDIESYGEAPLGDDGICPYGCDTPHIARTALAQIDKDPD